MAVKSRREKRQKRHFRARKRIQGCEDRPRLSVFKSNKHIVAQLINDKSQLTICSVASYAPEFKERIKGFTISGAETVGKAIAEKAKEKGIEKVVFDRGGNPYHGRVKALAEAARKTGLNF
jgi:large subunit ribosomal protein L18